MLKVNYREVPGSQGAIWGTETEDLDATLVRWNPGSGVASHTNTEVDVVMVVLEGQAIVIVDGESEELGAGASLVIPKGVARQFTAGIEPLTYLNIHKRRRAMMPNMTRPRPTAP